jgi:DNA-binding response OmpR family regulator
MHNKKPKHEIINEVLGRIKENLRKPQVLSVDDSPVILKAISVALDDKYDVFTLADPLLVERFLQQNTPDLILLDYKMPMIDGFDLIPVIRKFEKHKNTPIIFLTSMGTNDHVSAAAMLGACDFIVKPFHAEVLREKVAKHIVRKK